MNSGGFLDSHLSERTPIFGLRLWVLIGIGVGLFIALILACLLLIWLCSSGSAGGLSEKKLMIPVVSKEINVDHVSKNAGSETVVKKWAADVVANRTAADMDAKKSRTVRFKLADALSPKFLEDLEMGHHLASLSPSQSSWQAPSKEAAGMVGSNVRIINPRDDDPSAMHTTIRKAAERTETNGGAEPSPANEAGTDGDHGHPHSHCVEGSPTAMGVARRDSEDTTEGGDRCLRSHRKEESSAPIVVETKDGGAGERTEMARVEQEAGTGNHNEVSSGVAMEVARERCVQSLDGYGDGGESEASSRLERKEDAGILSFCAVCSDRETYCASSSSSSPAMAPHLGGWGQWYTLKDLQLATDFFSDANLLGEGGYGVVYRGHLPDGTFVAVKNLLNNRGQAEKEFKVEVEAIGRVRHKNLIRLIGYCAEGSHRMLVYEYVDNGNLDQWLHGKAGEGKGTIPWEARMKIALGTAKGLAYLHEGLEPKVVHRDVKSSNILLDTRWNAKVSDFGLAKLLGDGKSFVTTRVMGTFGYVAPEYANSGLLNERSDVYSFGVLLMEIITGRDPVDYSRPQGEVNLVDWLKMMVASRRAEDVVDPKLCQRPSSRALKRALLVALRCVDPDATKRPKMGHVVHMLEADDYPYRDDRRGSARMKNSPHHNHQVAMLARDAFNKDTLGGHTRASPSYVISPGRMNDDMFELVLESPSGPGYKPSLRRKVLVP